MKRSALYKQSSHFPMPMPEPHQSKEQLSPPTSEITMIKRSMLASKSPLGMNKMFKKADEAVQNLSTPLNDEDVPDDDDELATAAAKIPLDEILGKRSGSYCKDSLRYNPLNSCNETTSSVSDDCDVFALEQRKLMWTAFQDCSSIEEETKCVVCNANFPSVWLLEQHAALQHANLGPMDEKPFICEQCGQSYRYRSAYVKHREQNHRARLPADKLFTCDVCGMQFRYLKSFKKHRLNHALERLHGKCERRAAQLSTQTSMGNASDNANEMVTSSNETLTEEIVELQFAIKTEEEDDDREDSIGSPAASGNVTAERNTPTNLGTERGSIENSSHVKINSIDKHIVSNPMQRDDANFILKVYRLDSIRSWEYDYTISFSIYSSHDSCNTFISICMHKFINCISTNTNINTIHTQNQKPQLQCHLPQL